jgi:hypothetical protein
MVEDPIKLFATRSERLPQPDDGDTLRAAIEKGIEQVPVAGPITTFIASRFWVPSATRRLEEWLKEFADDFDRHREGCNVENMVKDEVFISASIQVARIVVGTHQQEKREYLRNALLNIAIRKEPSEEFQQIFLKAIEAFSVSHVRVLNVLWTGVTNLQAKGLWKASTPLGITDYAKAIGALHPELKGQDDLLRYIITDLRNWGMTNMGGPTDPFPVGGSQAITNMGVRFLQFVLNPEDLPK